MRSLINRGRCAFLFSHTFSQTGTDELHSKTEQPQTLNRQKSLEQSAVIVIKSADITRGGMHILNDFLWSACFHPTSSLTLLSPSLKLRDVTIARLKPVHVSKDLWFAPNAVYNAFSALSYTNVSLFDNGFSTWFSLQMKQRKWSQNKRACSWLSTCITPPKSQLSWQTL